MAEAVAVSRETDVKVKGTVPPLGLGVPGGTVQVPPRGGAATRLNNRGL
jgi:hypothetical protein